MCYNNLSMKIKHIYKMFDNVVGSEADIAAAVMEGKTFQDAFKFRPEQLQEFFVYGKELFYGGRYKEASDIFFFLIFLNPYLFETWTCFALAEYNQGHYEFSDWAFQMAITLHPLRGRTYLDFVQTLLERKEWDAARDVLDLMKMLLPNTSTEGAYHDAALRMRKYIEGEKYAAQK